jgi:hypothetical protein
MHVSAATTRMSGPHDEVPQLLRSRSPLVAVAAGVTPKAAVVVVTAQPDEMAGMSTIRQRAPIPTIST